MGDIQSLLTSIDNLAPRELEQVYQHVRERRRAHFAVWIVPPENIAKIEKILRPLQEDAAKMTEEEINTLIDEELAEVRRERKAKGGY